MLYKLASLHLVNLSTIFHAELYCEIILYCIIIPWVVVTGHNSLPRNPGVRLTKVFVAPPKSAANLFAFCPHNLDEEGKKLYLILLFSLTLSFKIKALQNKKQNIYYVAN